MRPASSAAPSPSLALAAVAIDRGLVLTARLAVVLKRGLWTRPALQPRSSRKACTSRRSSSKADAALVLLGERRDDVVDGARRASSSQMRARGLVEEVDLARLGSTTIVSSSMR